MSAPRQVLPGSTYLITRRCTQRQFLLRPSQRTNSILRYCLALAVERYPVDVHAFCYLSNHAHLVVTDHRGVLPEFMRYLHEMIARAINASLGRWENLWAAGTYSAVRLVSSEDIVDKVAYTLANPVAAGLVRRARRWPGLWSDTRDIEASPLVAHRPDDFFREEGPTPERCTLRLTCPPGFASRSDFVEAVELELRRREDAAAAAVHARGGDFLGVRAILRQRHTDAPDTREIHRGLNPRIAARDRRKRIEALQGLKAFLGAYRDAWHSLSAGVKGVFFPPGTYLLRVRHGVRCAPG